MPDLDVLADLVSLQRRIHALEAQLAGIHWLANRHRPGDARPGRRF